MATPTHGEQLVPPLYGTGGLASMDQVFNTTANEMFSFTQTSSVNMPLLPSKMRPEKSVPIQMVPIAK